ncbi:hypothetical protein [Heyndrickxia camelliae]|nr:hypothetical protein [Heyndrickxia camelliae]
MILYIILGIQTLIMLLMVAELMNIRKEIADVKDLVKKKIQTK